MYLAMCGLSVQADDDDTPDMGFNFSDESQGFSEASQSQMSQPSLANNDSAFNATSLTGDKLLSQPYKVVQLRRKSDCKEMAF